MAEKELYVATSIIPNIAKCGTDDFDDDQLPSKTMFWPFRPILLFGVESSKGEGVVFRAQI